DRWRQVNNRADVEGGRPAGGVGGVIDVEGRRAQAVDVHEAVDGLGGAAQTTAVAAYKDVVGPAAVIHDEAAGGGLHVDRGGAGAAADEGRVGGGVQDVDDVARGRRGFDREVVGGVVPVLDQRRGQAGDGRQGGVIGVQRDEPGGGVLRSIDDDGG